MNIYEKIKKLCSEKNVSITKLENICELSQNSIKKWDTNGIKASSPSADAIKKIAQYFNVSADYLLGLSADMYTSEIQELFDSLSPADKKFLLNEARELVKESALSIDKSSFTDKTGKI